MAITQARVAASPYSPLHIKSHLPQIDFLQTVDTVYDDAGLALPAKKN